MKRIMLFMMLMLGTVSAVMAQGADVPATDYDAMGYRTIPKETRGSRIKD